MMNGSFAAAFAYDPYQRILSDPTPTYYHHGGAGTASSQSVVTNSGHHHIHHGGGVSSNMGPSKAPGYPRLLFSIPSSLPYKEQKEKFESDDLFKKLARESEVRYTAFRDRPLHERQVKFQHSCREGSIELAQLSTGFSFFLNWNVLDNGYGDPRTMSRVDYHKERGKVHFDVPFIVNGVCVRWKGVLNMEKLDGVGALRFDDDSARIEDMAMRDKVESYKHAFREWEASNNNSNNIHSSTPGMESLHTHESSDVVKNE
ncbi:core-binding factor subunit beta [Lepeophtheirus salmonis]|uniref:Big brother n=2 Tax=Lepeophtheirus salmonis TaxID=72036 RepID=C1BTX9_LEPSM|nr:core-binding factor subunit beta-like [Lepeophtheirus salmonis]ACO12482.1 big brother [Lepeophtheirus salmonis]